MRLFVSYSRHDSSTVRRLVEALEAEGHDVWIDTDDIRGSERWRSSVATAIRASDVVLLVVSPAAMASSSVEREISVAAEESLRIVPVVIETAPISVGLQYDLAGVQRVSFVDRPFEDAMADLDAALVEPSSTTPDAQASTPTAVTDRPAAAAASASATRRRSGRGALYAVGAIVVIVVVVAAVLVARQAGSEDDVDGAGADVSALSPGASAAESGALPVGAATTSATFDTTVWFAGFSIQATGARYDETTGELTIDVVFTNDQRTTADPLGLLVGSTPLVVDGTRFALFCTNCSRLPPATSTRATLDATVPDGLDLAESSIEFGTPEQHQAIIPLDGGAGSFDSPTSAPIEGTLIDGTTTFTAETVEVVPAACSGLASDLAYMPGPADEMSIVVTGSAVTTERYGVNLGDALLTPPDGVTLSSNSLSGNIFALAPGVPQHDIPACFTVAAPVDGDYSFTVARAGASTFPDPIVITP
jgi:TIR domain